MSDPGRPAIKVGELSAHEFECLLSGDGAGIRIGPFDGLFRVRVPGIAGPLQALYADHPLLDHERVFSFHLMLREVPRLLPWRARKVRFTVDGRQPHDDMPFEHALAVLDGRELARSERTLLVDEQDHGLVFYFPRADVDFSALRPMPGHHTRCPWKGEASYWKLAGGDEPVAWAYEDPLPQVAQIRDHIAFYQNIVTVALGVAPWLPRWKPPKNND